MQPSFEGTMVYPGFHGVTNWLSPSFSPLTRLAYVAVREEPTGSIRALEFVSGKMIWEFLLKSPPWAGLMATAGGVVFGGSSEGMFYALER
jgi:alcohol dehydrogenase (cytochrome c)